MRKRYKNSQNKKVNKTITNRRLNPFLKFIWSKEWKEFRKKLLLKTKSCEICGRNKELIIHHLPSLSYFSLNPKNFRVLCRTCHGLLGNILIGGTYSGGRNFTAIKRKIRRIYKSKEWREHLERKN